MDTSSNRRQFVQTATALGAAGGISAALGNSAHGQQVAQAQGGAATANAPRALPHIHLMIGPGTLPSVGKDRMDLLRYRLSGNPRLTGEQMLEPLPEIAKVARVEVDKGNPYEQGSYEDLRKLALRADEVLRSPDSRIVRGNNWYEPGMVVADNLSPQKAALLLTLALTKTSDVEEIQRMFGVRHG
jgi:hypothetical protein